MAATSIGGGAVRVATGASAASRASGASAVGLRAVDTMTGAGANRPGSFDSGSSDPGSSDAGSRTAVSSPTTDDERRREALATNIARCALEAIAGVRDVDQLARWVTPAVYRALLVRVQHAARARRARRRSATRPNVQVRNLRAQHDERATEATLVVEFGPRVRAVCVHIELVESRWRATSVAVL